jgi:cytochrome c-type biogenesis protein CcmH/NrfG
MGLRDLQNGLAMVLKATEIKPQRGETWLNLGSTYITLQQKDKATEAFKKAIEVEPNNAKVRPFYFLLIVEVLFIVGISLYKFQQH